MEDKEEKVSANVSPGDGRLLGLLRNANVKMKYPQGLETTYLSTVGAHS